MANSKKVMSDLILNEFTGVWHDERNSEGTLLYESGSKYVGKLKSNKRYGQGVYTYPNFEELNHAKANNLKMILDKRDLTRKEFYGEWEDDIKIKGTLIYRNGDKYEGLLHKDEPHGMGTFNYAKGDVYKGNFQDGWIHGKGSYDFADGAKYTGSWEKGKKHGIGEFRLTDGSIYKGSYETDKQNGLGLLWLPDGSLNQGNFKDNQREGLQIIFYEETRDTAEAEYKDDKAEGLFAHHEPD